MILSDVAIDDNFLNNEVISSMNVHVSKKLFLPFPDSNDVVSQPLNTWKNRNTKDTDFSFNHTDFLDLTSGFCGVLWQPFYGNPC